MSKLNTMFVATVVAFMGTEENPASPDKNGKMPVLLNVVAGQCPSKRVIAGTVAERNNFETGKAYLFSATEGESSMEHGRQFNFSAVKEASLIEVVQAQQLMGPALIIDVVGNEVPTAVTESIQAEA